LGTLQTFLFYNELLDWRANRIGLAEVWMVMAEIRNVLARLYRCRIDGFSFPDRGTAVSHLRVSHSIDHYDMIIMTKLEF
jgi:hypothetical protein